MFLDQPLLESCVLDRELFFETQSEAMAGVLFLTSITSVFGLNEKKATGKVFFLKCNPYAAKKKAVSLFFVPCLKRKC